MSEKRRNGLNFNCLFPCNSFCPYPHDNPDNYVTGPTGATGATGPTGATGATGATGPAGSDRRYGGYGKS